MHALEAIAEPNRRRLLDALGARLGGVVIDRGGAIVAEEIERIDGLVIPGGE